MRNKVNAINGLKFVVIIFSGLLLGYLTDNRTDFSINLKILLDDGIFIVLGMTIITALTKQKIKIGIDNMLFGASLAVFVALFHNINLFLEVGEQNYDYILNGLWDFILITGISFIIGIVLSQYRDMGNLSMVISSLPAMYCGFTLCSYGVDKGLLYGAGVNLLILIAVFFLMGKDYIKQRIIFVIISLIIGYMYW